MREYILKQLRELSCVRGKQRTWVSDLTDERLYKLFIRLRNGENAKTIARFVQKGWGVNPEATVHSISQGILKFKKRIAHLLITSTTEGNCPGHFRGEVTPESTLESLDYIANLHRARIKAMMEEEKRTGIKYPYLHRDMIALATLQKLIMRQKTWEKYNDDPMKQKRMAGLEKEIGEKFEAAMDEIGEEGRVKIVKALDRFMDLAKAHSIPGEIGPDGKLRLIEPKNDRAN